MARENLLRFANEKKPADFAKEFKSQLHQVVAQKLTAPRTVVEADEDDAGE